MAIVDQQKNEKEIKVIEDVILLEIQAVNQIEFNNIGKRNLDVEDLDKNIEKVDIEGNLSPKQIDKMRESQGIQNKKDKGANASSMQTRSSLKNHSR